MLDGQPIWIEHQDIHDLPTQRIIAALKSTNAKIVNPADLHFVQSAYDVAVNNLVNQVGYLINGYQLLSSIQGFE
jgi:hypothetical protein